MLQIKRGLHADDVSVTACIQAPTLCYPKRQNPMRSVQFTGGYLLLEDCHCTGVAEEANTALDLPMHLAYIRFLFRSLRHLEIA